MGKTSQLFHSNRMAAMSGTCGPQSRFDLGNAGSFSRTKKIEGNVNLSGPGPSNGPRRDRFCQSGNHSLQTRDNVRRRKGCDK